MYLQSRWSSCAERAPAKRQQVLPGSSVTPGVGQKGAAASHVSRALGIEVLWGWSPDLHVKSFMLHTHLLYIELKADFHVLSVPTF